MCVIGIYIYIRVCMYVVVAVVVVSCVFWCDLALAGLYHLSILIFGSQGSKATCSNLHLALDHLITSNSFTYPKLSQMFQGFFRYHVVYGFWGIRAILKLLYSFFLSKKMLI